MFSRMVSLTAASLALCTFAGAAFAQASSTDQQEVWKFIAWAGGDDPKK